MIEYKTVKVECPDDKSGFEFVGETLNKHAVDGWEYIGVLTQSPTELYVNLKKVTEPQFLAESSSLDQFEIVCDQQINSPEDLWNGAVVIDLSEHQHEPEHNRYSVPR